MSRAISWMWLMAAIGVVVTGYWSAGMGAREGLKFNSWYAATSI